MRIIFMGTPEFAVPSLERLCQAGYVPVAVATGPDRPRGRGRKMLPSAVKEGAVRLGIGTILQPESVRDPAFAEAVRGLAADLIVVVAFRILPPEVFTAARTGAFNLHGSLLPRYRGAAPIHRAVMAGETETGVTTFFLRERVDTGNVILRRSMAIGPEETTGDVHDRMMHLGAEVVVDTVGLIERGEVREEPQDERLATPAPKVFREEGEIDWSAPADRVHNLVRGLSPVPGAWTLWRDGELKLYRSRRAEGRGAPGQVLDAADRLVVACGHGAVEILSLQAEGRRVLDADAFLRGSDLGEGEVLGRGDPAPRGEGL
jgi:methionyl-tRNA formyltransferase